MVLFYTHSRTCLRFSENQGFPMFSGCIEREHWPEMVKHIRRSCSYVFFKMAAFKNVAYFKGKHWEIYKIFKSDVSYKTPPVAFSGI